MCLSIILFEVIPTDETQDTQNHFGLRARIHSQAR